MYNHTLVLDFVDRALDLYKFVPVATLSAPTVLSSYIRETIYDELVIAPELDKIKSELEKDDYELSTFHWIVEPVNSSNNEAKSKKD